MRFLKSVVALSLICLVVGAFASVQSQTAGSSGTYDASFQGYIETGDGTRVFFENGKPCQGYWVEFVATDQKSGLTHSWYLNGAKNPYGPNLTSLRFSLGGVGDYTVQHDVYDLRGASGTASYRFASLDCGAPTTASPPSPTASATAYAHILVQSVCVESIALSGEYSEGANKASIVSYAWTVSGPDFSQSFDGRTISFAARSEGGYKVFLRVKDANGNIGDTVIENQFYLCKRDGSQPSAAPTATAYYSACDDLLAQQQEFYADWKYRYNEYANSGKTDAAYEARLNDERNGFEAAWNQRWDSAGCNTSGTSDRCSTSYAQAQPSLEAIQQRYDALWAQHWRELDSARKNYSATFHTQEEWAAFEDKFARLADDLSTRQQAEVDVIVGKYGLYDCGYYYRDYGSDRQDYSTVYGVRPAAVGAFEAEIDACSQKLLLVKESYGARLDLLYRELSSMPAGSAYDAKKAELVALESRMREEMAPIMQACRGDIQEDYAPPTSYKEGSGDLACYFDEAIHRVACDGKYIGFEGNPDTQQIYAYHCGGQFFFDEIRANAIFEDFSFQEGDDGGVFAIRSERLKMLLHDSPRGVINLGVTSGAELYFVPAGYLSVTASAGKVVLEGAGSRGAFVGNEKSLEWDALKRVLTVRDEATWFSETCFADGSKVDGSEDDKFFEAIAAKRLGATVRIAPEGGGIKQDDEKYDDAMEVKVERQGDKRYEATIDSLDEGCRSVVLKFDGDIFDSIKLKVTLTDEKGGKLEIREASSLDDVLDPCDDGDEGFEYWIVADRLGTHVILSFAHFSEKRVSVEAASVGNVIVPGFGLDLVVLAVAAGVLGWESRRRLIR
jgi:hypothetical protein